jgi:hypothetical protein
MELNDIVSVIPNFSSWNHADKIRFFAWYLQSKKGRDRFQASDISVCYDKLKIEKPSSISPFLAQMEKRKPQEVLRNGQGYSLERRVRDKLESKYGQRSATVQADKLLLSLPEKIPDLAERTFLNEAIICFRHKAFRAAIVMTWNLAYHHLCDHILRNRLSDFNREWPVQFAKKHAQARTSAISVHDDFAELKESEVLQICRAANIITQDMNKVLKEKLDKRNSAAHPSSVVITPHTTEEYIIDLVTNVVLKLV